MASLPLNQVQPTRRLDHAAHLPRLERKSRILKLLLHITLAKVPEITALAGRRAVALGEGQLPEGNGARLDLLLVGEDDLHGLILGARDLGLAPAAGSATLAVLDEEVGGADLALGDAGGGSRAGTGTVVGGHVVLQFVGVGAGGRFPAGDLFEGVEVVGEVLGVGVADLPVGRQPGVGLGGEKVSCFCQRELRDRREGLASRGMKSTRTMVVVVVVGVDEEE